MSSNSYIKRMSRHFNAPRCPVCGRPGSGPYKRKVRGHEYLYFAHSTRAPKTRKRGIKWCYVGSARAIEAAGGMVAYLEMARSKAKA